MTEINARKMNPAPTKKITKLLKERKKEKKETSIPRAPDFPSRPSQSNGHGVFFACLLVCLFFCRSFFFGYSLALSFFSRAVVEVVLEALSHGDLVVCVG